MSAGLEITSITPHKLQPVDVQVNVKASQPLDLLSVSSGASSPEGKSEEITAAKVKRGQTLVLTQRLLVTENDKGYLSVVLNDQPQAQSVVPAKIDVPFSYTNAAGLKFEKPQTTGPKETTLGSVSTKALPQKVNALDGYEVQAKVSLGLQKAGVRPGDKVTQLAVGIATGGGVQLTLKEPLPAIIPVSDFEKVENLPLRIAVGQRGTCSVHVVAQDADGKPLYSENRTIYLLADENTVYTGRTGYLELEIKRLKDALASGKISKGEYDAELSNLLTAKAQKPHE
ncbi:MAG TPA: hypothetical protein VII23_18665 [Terriglobales bacterium]